MIAAARIVLSAVLFFHPITAQTPAKATASIAGRISIGAQPAAGEKSQAVELKSCQKLNDLVVK